MSSLITYFNSDLVLIASDTLVAGGSGTSMTVAGTIQKTILIPQAKSAVGFLGSSFFHAELQNHPFSSDDFNNLVLEFCNVLSCLPREAKDQRTVCYLFGWNGQRMEAWYFSFHAREDKSGEWEWRFAKLTEERLRIFPYPEIGSFGMSSLSNFTDGVIRTMNQQRILDLKEDEPAGIGWTIELVAISQSGVSEVQTIHHFPEHSENFGAIRGKNYLTMLTSLNVGLA